MTPIIWTHEFVIHFLTQHGYVETLEVFRREAREYLGETDSQTTGTAVNGLATALFNLALDTEKSSSSQDNSSTTLIHSIDNLHHANILAVAVEQESLVLATSSTDKTVKLCHDLGRDQRGLPPQIYRHHQAPVLSIEFHPQNPHLMLTTSMDGSSVLVDTRAALNDVDPEVSGVVQRFKDHQKYVVRGTFSPSGATMATASYDQTVCVYQQANLADGAIHYELVNKIKFPHVVNTLCFLDEAMLVVGLQNNNYLHYVRVDDGKWTQTTFNLNENGDDHVSFSPVWLSFSPDGRRLLCTTDSASGLVILLETQSSKQLKRYYIKPSDDAFTTRRHCWHPSGKFFYVSGGEDTDIHVARTETGEIMTTLSGHKSTVRAMTLNADIGLISVGYDHLLNVWAGEETIPVNR